MSLQLVPDGVRVAVYNAMGGWGPYTVAEIEELFRMYGFSERTPTIEDVGGARRSMAEAFQRRIDWGDAEQRKRYLMLIDDVLENYPDEDGKPNSFTKKVRRALELAGVGAHPQPSGVGGTEAADDLWPVDTVRVFVSHLAERRQEVHDLAKVLRQIGFSCFVAHDEIRPSRSWLKEIERALRSCDLLVAYVSPGFSQSDWTDQEVGWALGRELVAIPVSVDGEIPKGFLGNYQAVRRHPNQAAMLLGREVCKAIVDAVFEEQRPAAGVVRARVAALISGVFCKVRTYESARFWYGLVVRVPLSDWTATMRANVGGALKSNDRLTNAMLEDGSNRSVPEAVASFLGLDGSGS
jgi:TIR domain